MNGKSETAKPEVPKPAAAARASGYSAKAVKLYEAGRARFLAARKPPPRG